MFGHESGLLFVLQYMNIFRLPFKWTTMYQSQNKENDRLKWQAHDNWESLKNAWLLILHNTVARIEVYSDCRLLGYDVL